MMNRHPFCLSAYARNVKKATLPPSPRRHAVRERRRRPAVPILDEHQQRRALGAYEQYANAPSNADGLTPRQSDSELDTKRNALIASTLKPLLDEFIAGAAPLLDFKTSINKTNANNKFWGFNATKGQMFFNLLFKAADTPECTAELQEAFRCPENEDIARSRIRAFIAYVRRIGDALIDAGESKFRRPQEKSVPFFLSYFWHLSAPDVWPVMYTTSCNAMTDLNLWQASEDLADDYITFKNTHEELQTLFQSHAGHPFDLYQVEHVFWFLTNSAAWMERTETPSENHEIERAPVAAAPMERLPDSYAPPIISILSRLACPDAQIEQAAENSGISVARAFEKSIHAAFTMLGYDARLLGSGTGREPDGLALCEDYHYALIWDAKSRTDGYGLGSRDDRAIREYITNKARELRRQYRNIYFVIISGTFHDDFSDTILRLKMETEVKEVCLLEADALIAVVETYLKKPRDFSFGPDGLQQLFANPPGVITRQTVIDLLS